MSYVHTTEKQGNMQLSTPLSLLVHSSKHCVYKRSGAKKARVQRRSGPACTDDPNSACTDDAPTLPQCHMTTTPAVGSPPEQHQVPLGAWRFHRMCQGPLVLLHIESLFSPSRLYDHRYLSAHSSIFAIVKVPSPERACFFVVGISRVPLPKAPHESSPLESCMRSGGSDQWRPL